MEVVNYRRQGVESRKSAYRNQYIDEDLRRILEKVDPDLIPAEDATDLNAPDDSSDYDEPVPVKKSTLNRLTGKITAHRGRGNNNEAGNNEVQKEEAQPLQRVPGGSNTSKRQQTNTADELTTVKSSEALLKNILNNVRDVSLEGERLASRSPYLLKIKAALSSANFRELLTCIEEKRASTLAITVTVMYSSKAGDGDDVARESCKNSFNLPLLHALVLHSCYHRDEHTINDICNIIRAMFKDGGEKGIKAINRLDQWEIKPTVLENVSALHMAAYYGNTPITKLLIKFGANVNLKNELGNTPLLMAITEDHRSVKNVIYVLINNRAKPDLGNTDGTTPLHKALAIGISRQFIECMVEFSATVNLEKRRGLPTPLMQAVTFRDKDVVKLLLDRGANVFTSSRSGQTALHYAASVDSFQVVSMLLDVAKAAGKVKSLLGKIDVSGESALFLAIKQKHVNTVQVLLKYMNSLDVTNVMEKNVWNYAFEQTDDEILDLLIAKHKTIIKHENINGRPVPVVKISPLHVAARLDNPALVQKVIDKGINIHEVDEEHQHSFLHVAAEHSKLNVLQGVGTLFQPADLLLTNLHQETPIHRACKHGDAETVKIILDSIEEDQLAAYLNRKNSNGATACYEALLQKEPRLALAILSKVTSAENTFIDAIGNSYLHMAAKHNHFTDVVERLCKMGINTNHRNNYGFTALQEAAHHGNLNIVKTLLKTSMPPVQVPVYNVDVQLVNNEGRTALHEALRSKRASGELLKTIIDAMTRVDPVGSFLNEYDHSSYVPLHYLIRKGRRKYIITELLNQFGQNINLELQNNKGNTILHQAAEQYKDEPLIAILDFAMTNKLRIDKCLNLTNWEGKTVLMLCMENGHTGVIKRLLKLGSTDLCKRSPVTGDTPLHHLVRLSAEEPEHDERWEEIYWLIVDNAVPWWCNYHRFERRLNNDPRFKSIALKFLTSVVRNTNDDDAAPVMPFYKEEDIGEVFDPLKPDEGDGVTVIQLATILGATSMLDVIYRTGDVYKIKGVDSLQLDVTHILPETSKVGHRVKTNNIYAKLSYVESLCLLHSDEKIVEGLDIRAFKSLSMHLWGSYQWIYGVMMIFHLIYMSVFSYFGLRAQLIPSQNTLGYVGSLLAKSGNPLPMNAGTINVTNGTVAPTLSKGDSIGMFVLLLGWPAVTCIYLLSSITFNIMSKACGPKYMYQNGGGRKITFHNISKFIFKLCEYDMFFFGLAFSISVGLWYVFLAFESIIQIYFLVVALFLGWMYTIAFTRGFESIHQFSLILRYIVLIDISRFLFVFAFVFLGFSFALQAMFLHSPTVAAEFPSMWITFFFTFRVMLGIDDPFTDAFQTELTLAGISPILPKLAYFTFMLISSIVLLNLLIAMMTDTNTMVTEKKVTHWRVNNVRLALGLEKQLGRISKWLRFEGKKEFKLEKISTSIYPKSKYGEEYTLITERIYATFPIRVKKREELDQPIVALRKQVDEQMENLNGRISKIESTLQEMTSLLRNKHHHST